MEQGLYTSQALVAAERQLKRLAVQLLVVSVEKGNYRLPLSEALPCNPEKRILSSRLLPGE